MDDYGPGEDPTALEITYHGGDLSDAEIAAIRDSGLTRDTSYSVGFDWGGLFKTAATGIFGAAAAILPAALTRQTQPAQLRLGTAPAGARYIPATSAARYSSGGPAPVSFLGGGGGFDFGSFLQTPMGIAVAVGAFLLLLLVARK